MITLEVAPSVETVQISAAATGAAFAATAETIHTIAVRLNADSVASSVTAGASGAAIPASVAGIHHG